MKTARQPNRKNVIVKMILLLLTDVEIYTNFMSIIDGLKSE